MSDLSTLAEVVLSHIDIPVSYYRRATDRHRSVGGWLCRPASRLAGYNPVVSPQGSFRYGTVVLPLVSPWSYDLDNVTTLEIAKSEMTQRELKDLYGGEIRSYAEANGIKAPVEEKNRCWRLVYADEVDFHLDTLPCIPEGAEIIESVVRRGVVSDLASLAVSITDRRHPQYNQLTKNWLSSNPRGFAAWFEQRALSDGLDRRRVLVESGLYTSVEDVPPFEWKTPLQRSIQVLKRHRDAMFQSAPARAPISMIITNLAANAYEGEQDLGEALGGIVKRMPRFVRDAVPRIPNPADPAEDYADRWRLDPSLEGEFWNWYKQLSRDLGNMPDLVAKRGVVAGLREAFAVSVSQDDLARATSGTTGLAGITVAGREATKISSAPKPWRGRA